MAEFRERLRAGAPLIGSFLKLPSTQGPEILGSLGFDFAVIDEEHAALNPETTDMMLLACRAAGLAGVVRVEIGAAVGIERAKALAVLAAGMLPRFASSPTRDPRAPQNLLPVGALEQEMRRRMGDMTLIRRAIEKSLHEQRDR